MKVVYHNDQKLHYPERFLVNGCFQPNPEMPQRLDRLLKGALAAGCTPETPSSHGMEPIEAIHSPAYLRFLENAYERWKRIEGAADAVTPNVHPDSRQAGYPASVVAQAGYHMADAAAPIANGSWDSICWSAWTVVHAANLVLAGEASAYALCRPPGHHAFTDMAGGFCYLNNSAIGAQQLLRAFDRVAILDVDLHHGNGTQQIFEKDPSVFYYSIHQHPSFAYPGTGREFEQGSAEGQGFTKNTPVLPGHGDEEYAHYIKRDLLPAFERFRPEVILVSAGFDAHIDDDMSDVKLSTEAFTWLIETALRLAEEHAHGRLISVLEGGYSLKRLPVLAANHVKALLGE